jgi:hypothetical protein
MTWAVGDRVKETTTSTGAGDVALAGAVAQFQAFSAVCANGDRVYYAIVGQSGTEWEVGLGTWVTGNTLQRTKVLASSNGGAAVTFSAGTKDVFGDFPAGEALLPVVQRLQQVDAIIPPGASVYVPKPYEIAAGKTLEIGPGAVLEIG